MTRSEQMIIKLEFDKSIRYLDSRKDKLTIGECLQELGHLRMFVYQLGVTESTKNVYGQEILK